MKKIFSLAFVLLSLTITAQITTSPVFPTENDAVTITYDASQGNGALTGVSPVYIHTGVITNLSTSLSDWKYVRQTWGTTVTNAQMTSLGNNRWQYVFSPSLRLYYGVTGTETINFQSYVFRNASGSVVGRATSGADMYTTVYAASATLLTSFVTPNTSGFLAAQGSSIPVDANANISASLTLYDNGSSVATANGTRLQHNITAGAAGNHVVVFEAVSGAQTSRDTFSYVVAPSVVVQDPPAGMKDGANFLPNGDVLFQLFAPNKTNVCLIGSFSNFAPDASNFMKRSTDGNVWWIQKSGLASNQNHTYQYYIDGTLTVADPLSELVLNKWDDPYIPATTYPSLPTFPTAAMGNNVSLIRPGATPYAWTNSSFTPPARKDLVVYELLIRDFIAAQNYNTLLDTLPYLQRLGVNVIQLMPIQEFEGNISWGYNPSFHGAVDKYYGTPNALKRFIDTCHSRGIAVVLDVVFNHACGQSPLAQMYWDAANNQPAANSPFFNAVARHPFNVCSDFNHEATGTRRYIDQVMTRWLSEYKFDGFRFDLSKGFTQTNSGSNVGQWGNYDQSRINNLQRIYDVCRQVNPNFFPILEHFADNSEEQELSWRGFMMWASVHGPANEASMGYTPNSDMSNMSWRSRTMNAANLVGFMESHDEERLPYKNLTFGNNTNSSYNVRSITNTVGRMEMMGVLFFSVPGPKMIWQFGELAYDKSIYLCSDGTISTTGGCRTDAKPILWNYYNQTARRKVYNVWKEMIKLKKSVDAFEDDNFTAQLGGQIKVVYLTGASNRVISVANTGVQSSNATINFSQAGTWYSYFTGDSIVIANAGSQSLSLNAGEYRLYTRTRLVNPLISGIFDSGHDANAAAGLEIFPNPADGNGLNYLRYELLQAGSVRINIHDMTGRQMDVLLEESQSVGPQLIEFSAQSLQAGVYFVSVLVDGKVSGTSKLVVVK